MNEDVSPPPPPTEIITHFRAPGDLPVMICVIEIDGLYAVGHTACPKWAFEERGAELKSELAARKSLAALRNRRLVRDKIRGLLRESTSVE